MDGDPALLLGRLVVVLTTAERRGRVFQDVFDAKAIPFHTPLRALFFAEAAKETALCGVVNVGSLHHRHVSHTRLLFLHKKMKNVKISIDIRSKFSHTFHDSLLEFGRSVKAFELGSHLPERRRKVEDSKSEREIISHKVEGKVEISKGPLNRLWCEEGK